MPFVKGQSGNAGGRPSDPNIKLIREAQRVMLKDGLKKLKDALNDLDGKDYIEFYLRIQKEVLPSMPAEMTDEDKERSVVSIFEMIDKRLREEMAKKAG